MEAKGRAGLLWPRPLILGQIAECISLRKVVGSAQLFQSKVDVQEAVWDGLAGAWLMHYFGRCEPTKLRVGTHVHRVFLVVKHCLRLLFVVDSRRRYCF